MCCYVQVPHTEWSSINGGILQHCGPLTYLLVILSFSPWTLAEKQGARTQWRCSVSVSRRGQASQVMSMAVVMEKCSAKAWRPQSVGICIWLNQGIQSLFRVWSRLGKPSDWEVSGRKNHLQALVGVRLEPVIFGVYLKAVCSHEGWYCPMGQAQQE